MWKKIKAQEYYLTYSKFVDIEIFLTDYITLWHLYQTSSQFFRNVKESNIINMKEDVMLQKALGILSNPDDIDNAQIKQESDSVNLTLNKRFGYPFKLNIKLKQASRELKITQPLLKTIQDLHTSQSELIRFVKEKDVEIEAYKRIEPNMKISYYERTDKFDEQNYVKKYTKYEDCFGSSSIPSPLLNKSVFVPEASEIQVQKQNLDIKQEIKEELLSQNLEIGTFNGAEINNIKQELDTPESTVKISIREDADVSVKRELEVNTSPRKKIKKLNLI